MSASSPGRGSAWKRKANLRTADGALTPPEALGKTTLDQVKRVLEATIPDLEVRIINCRQLYLDLQLNPSMYLDYFRKHPFQPTRCYLVSALTDSSTWRKTLSQGDEEWTRFSHWTKWIWADVSWSRLAAEYGAISEQTVASAEIELGKLRSQHQEFGHSIVQ